MIISRGSKPEYSLYFLGAEILKVLQATRKSRYDSFQLYKKIKLHKPTYSLNQYLLALDWLFLLGAVYLTPEGRLRLC